MKMDLKKTYHPLDWCFIEDLLNALKFAENFVEMVMECVKTLNFSLMINGSLVGFFKGKRVLRQGDPLSPLLFVITDMYGVLSQNHEESWRER